MTCVSCGRELCRDETGLSRKLINRGTEVFYCMECLSERFKLSKEQLSELVEHFRKSGCTLFL